MRRSAFSKQPACAALRSFSNCILFNQARGIWIEQDERPRRTPHDSGNWQLGLGTGQRFAYGGRLRPAERDNHNSFASCEHAHRQRHPSAGRLRSILDDSDEVSGVLQNRMAWEQRCDVSIWTHSEQDEVEPWRSACDPLQFGTVGRDCLSNIRIVRRHPMDPFGRDLRGLQPERASLSIVRFGVTRRNRSFIRPKKLGPRPVEGNTSEAGEEIRGDRTTRQRHGEELVSGQRTASFCQELGCQPFGQTRSVVDDDLRYTMGPGRA
jgi:hypothetical protein